MRTSGTSAFAAALLLCALPTAGAAFDWSGRLGLLYDRTDSWYESGAREELPRLDLELRLDVAGAIVAPGVFSWGGFVSYRYQTIAHNGAQTNRTDALGYHLDAALFRHPRSPFSLTALADRYDGRYTTYSGGTVVGDRKASAHGGTLRLMPAGAPSVDAGYTRYEMEETTDSALSRVQNVDVATGRVAHSTGAFGIDASYRGEFSDGTWVSDRYDSHEVNVTGNSVVGTDQDVTIVDRYYRRVPTTAATEAFASELNSFRASYRNGFAPGSSSVLQYSNQRSVTQSGGNADDTLFNSLQYRHDQRLGNSEYFVRGVLDLSLSEQRRTGIDPLATRGGTVGAELWWRRFASTGVKLRPGVEGSILYELAAGPLAGVLDTEGGTTRPGYGGMFHARIGVPWGDYQVGGIYEVLYTNELYGRPGWNLSQSGNGTIGGRLGSGALNASLGISAQRSWSPVFGDGASQSINGNLSYAVSRYTFTAQGAFAQGVVPGAKDFLGDGFFVPVGFDTRQASGGLSAATALFSGMTARLDGRYSQSMMPGQPDYTMNEVAGMLVYQHGAFSLSVEDRLSRTEQNAARLSRNVLFVRLSRSIGSRR